MTNPALTAAYQHAHDDYVRAITALIPVVTEMALETTASVLPSAHSLEVLGAFTEDWLRTLRIQRVLDEQGVALFDVREGHENRIVEDAIDEVNTEYLDLLLDLTGDDYMGAHTIDRSDVTDSSSPVQ